VSNATSAPARNAEPVVSTEGRNHRPGRRRGSISWWWAVPAGTLLLAIHYLAIAAGGVYAFTDAKGVRPGKFIGLDNFVKIFSTPENQTALINTLVMAVVFVVVTSLLGLGFALLLNRGLKLRYFLRVLFFAPVVLSPLAVSYIWKFIYQPTGPLNELLRAVGLGEWTKTWLGDPTTAVAVIMVVLIWQNFGLAMVIYLAGLANVPPELEEAAAIDGAGMFKSFWNVTLPLLRPAMAISVTLLMIQGLRVFDQVLALTNGGPYGASETIATLVYKHTFASGEYGYGAALSVLLTVLIAAVSVVQNVAMQKKED
jgi:raffinose/stachyose/melibiose transport system permease protein